MPFVNVRITPTPDGVTREQKAQVIKEITETLERVLDKQPELTHIVIEEVDVDNWGYAGLTTAEHMRRKADAGKSNAG
jgi:4-oxalocrotonate tautomerase